MVMAGSIAYVNYENHVRTSGYPDYHVNVHILTVVDNYPIELSGVPSGTGYYQQLLTIKNPSKYGINTAGSNIQFSASNGTLLYAWIQSVNQGTEDNFTVWVKNFNGSSTIDMQVMPEFENLFSSTGYLGTSPTINRLTDNGYSVFTGNSIYDNFQNATSLSNFYTFGDGSYVSASRGLNILPGTTANTGIFSHTNYTESGYFLTAITNQTGSNSGGRYAGWNGIQFGYNTSWGSPLAITSGTLGVHTSFTAPEISEMGFTFSSINDNQSLDLTGLNGSNYGGSFSTQYTANISSQLILAVATTSGVTYPYFAFIPMSQGMPTFAIGNGTNLGNLYTQNINIAYNHQNITIPSGNWYNVSLKAYSNYSYSFYYNDSPMYFNYSGLINNTFYTGFLDRNVTARLNFIGDTYTGKTGLVVLEKGE